MTEIPTGPPSFKVWRVGQRFEGELAELAAMREMAEHTAGPWKWHWRNDESTPGSVYAEPREGHAYAIAMMPRYQTKEQWAADARLIAAAPDMLEALRDVASTLDWASEHSMEGRLRRVALAAIAKATGA